MERSKVDWCDYTYNPITGCLHNCKYCDARIISKRFAGDPRANRMQMDQYHVDGKMLILDSEFKRSNGTTITYPFGIDPTLHRYRVNNYCLKVLKKGRKVFVGSTANMFGEWVKDEWIQEVFNACRNHEQHVYLFLTKDHYRYTQLQKKGMLPSVENMWYGFSINDFSDGAIPVKEISFPHVPNIFVSADPLLFPLSIDDFDIKPAWVVIGAEGRKGKFFLPKEWIDHLVAECDLLNIPVFMRKSLVPVMGNSLRQDFPERMEKYLEGHALSPSREKLFYDQCMKCKERKKKDAMIGILAKHLRKGNPQLIGFICQACAESIELKYGIKFKNMEVINEKTEL